MRIFAKWKVSSLGTTLPLLLSLAFLSISLPTNSRAATTYDVGAGQPFITLASLPALQPGDVVNIHCGTYHEVRIWSASGTPGSPITLQGVCASGRPVIDGTGLDTSGNGGPRGDWEIQGSNYVIANLEFTNARNGNNAAGLRVMNANVTVTNCRMDNNDMGIMTSTTNVDNLVVQNSEIAYNGEGSDQSHNIYLTSGNTVTFAYCYIHDSTSGENVKSRAHYTQLFYNYIAFGAESEVEGLDGAQTVAANSNMTMIGNVLVSTPNRTVNYSKFVVFGQDVGGAHNGTLYLINNTLIAGSGSIGFLRSSATNSAIVAANNIFYGSDTIVNPLWTTNVSGSNNWVPTTASLLSSFTNSVFGTLPGFVDASNYNYQLTATSPARDIAAASPVYYDGNGVSHSAVPTYSYVHPLSSMPRVNDGTLDAGAYEFAGTSTTVTSSPAGLSLVVDGAGCTAPCTFQWTPNSTHTIGAANQAGATGVNYLFSSWSDGGAGSHTVTAGANGGAYTASFTTQYYLTTGASAGGSISPGTGWYNAGSTITISATAASGYQFTGFSGSVSGTSTPVNYTMNGPASVTATFATASVPTTTVTSNPSGRSLVVDGAGCTAPCTFQWAANSTHTIGASNQAGATGVNYLFSSWSDGGAASHTITVGANGGTYTASFATQYLLTTSASSGGSISPGTGWYNAGSVATISAAAATGYQFTGFSGSLSGTSTPVNYTMNGPASVTASFAAVSGGSSVSWYGVGGTWSSRKSLTINHAMVSGSSALSNFPVLISITDSNLKATARSDAGDILFTAADGVTKLRHEIEQYNSATGQLIAWVAVPALSPASDTGIYIYYGNPAAANQQSYGGAWDANYKGVWHFGASTALNLFDSTSMANNGAAVASPAVGIGKIGGAVSLNGWGQAIDVGQKASLNVGSTFTVEAWVNPSALTGHYGVFTTRATNAAGSWQVEIGNDGNGKGGVALTGPDTYIADTPAGVLATGTWLHIAVTKNGSGDTAAIYVNGQPMSLSRHTSFTAVDNASDKFIGEGTSGSQFFQGSMDEVRLSNTARSATWIATEFANQKTPGTFVAVGAQQAHP